MDAASAPIIAASISLIGTVVLAIVTWINAWRTRTLERRLDAERAQREAEAAVRDEQIALRKSKHDARVDYEYEARKRLYVECEPLLFQFFELAEDASRRVMSLARTCRNDDLRPDGGGWLDREGYYFNSTAYALLAPLAAIRMLQRRLTLVDLGMDSGLQLQYQLMRIIYRSFCDDQTIARHEPRLEYMPDKADPEEPNAKSLKAETPRVYMRQGFYRGTLDRLVDALILHREEGDRVVFYGEFIDIMKGGSPRIAELRMTLRELLIGFHPAARPVFWRLLVTQVFLYDALDRSRTVANEDGADLRVLFPPPSARLIADLDWRLADAVGTPDPVTTVAAAAQYVRGCVAERGLTRPRTSPRSST